MLKRPLCLIAVFLLVLQAILVGGFEIAQGLKPSYLELNYREREKVSLIGKVYDREIKNSTQLLYLKSISSYHSDKVLIFLRNETFPEQNIKIGDTIEVFGRIDFFDVSRNQGNFNQKFYYQKQGICGQIRAERVGLISTQSDVNPREFFLVFKHAWQNRLIEELGDKYGGLLSAILLGERNSIGQETKNLFQKAGIGHILAISGLHMSFFGIGCYGLLRKTGASFLWAGLAVLILLILYTAMVGLSVSVIRALCMFAIRIGAEILGRNYDAINSLAISFLAVFSWRPLSIFDVGFLFSFAAVLSLILLRPVFKKILFSTKKQSVKDKIIIANLKMSLSVNLAINLMLFPILLYFYFEFPVYSILINMLLVSLMPIILGAGLIGSALLWIPFVGGNILQISKGILWFYETTCEFFLALPFSRMVTGQPKVWQIVVYYVCMLAFYLYFRRFQKEQKEINRPTRQKLQWKMAIFVFFMMMTLFPIHYFHKDLTVTMLDVGQGDGFFMRGPKGNTYLFDGGSSNVNAVGLYRITPFLSFQGVHSLDYVFVSHGDTDHHSGIEELLLNQKNGIKIKTLVLPAADSQDESLKMLAGLARAHGTRVSVIEAGQSLTEGNLEIYSLGPSKDYDLLSSNDSSMILSIRYGDFSMLFTGDIESNGEQVMVRQGLLEKHKVLKVAHHGSKTSSTEMFLAEVSPKVAFISAGIQNLYGHPHGDVVKRLKEQGIVIFNTQESGAVTIRSDGQKMKISTFLR